MKRTWKSLFLAALVTVPACGNDDSDVPPSQPPSPLLGFHGGECKKDSETVKMGVLQQKLVADDVYAGLRCIRWNQVDDTSIKIELINYDSACGAEWTGQATTTDSEVVLRVVNPECLIASCGSCIYDWSFEVSYKPSGAQATVQVEVDTCPGNVEMPVETESASIPIGTSPQGELCQYATASALGWQAGSLNTCGAAYMPCRENGGQGMCQPAEGEQACDEGLECADGATAEERICHVPCTVDGDCLTEEGTMKCDDGLCRPTGSW